MTVHVRSQRSIGAYTQSIYGTLPQTSFLRYAEVHVLIMKPADPELSLRFVFFRKLETSIRYLVFLLKSVIPWKSRTIDTEVRKSS